MSIIYRCYFDVSASGNQLQHTDIPDIGTAKEGFWVDSSYEFNSLGSQTVYWIAPASIRFVQKIVKR